MDRRQRKTRQRIFQAFISLLSEKSYEKITVGQVIQRADVGRATFYAHFETKEFLLKALCRELFDHIFESAAGSGHAHTYIFDCEAPDSVFLHLLQHLQKNDNNILQLLSCQNNALFLRYFQDELIRLAESQQALFASRKDKALPQDFWVRHIAATFVETVRWWIEKGMEPAPETVNRYFLLAV